MFHQHSAAGLAFRSAGARRILLDISGSIDIASLRDEGNVGLKNLPKKEIKDIDLCITESVRKESSTDSQPGRALEVENYLQITKLVDCLETSKPTRGFQPEGLADSSRWS